MDNFKKKLSDEIEEFREVGHRFIKGEMSVMQFKHASGGMGMYAHRGGKEFMLRFRIPSGVTHADELKLVYNFAKEKGLGGIHLTTRQAIQLHGMQFDDVCDLMQKGLDVNLFTRGAGGNFPRNVALSPLSGVDKEEAFDPTPYALATGNHFLRKISTYKLPRKLKVSFSNTEEDTAHCTVQDLGFMATEKDGKKYFKVFIGGGLGNNPRKAIEVDELIDPSDVLYYIEGMTNLFIAEGDYENKAKARIRYIPNRIGDEQFVKLFKEYSEAEKQKEDLKLHLHSNEVKKQGIMTDINDKRLYKQKQQGLYSVYLHPIGGQLKLDDLREIIEIIEKFEEIDIRLSMCEGLYIRNLNGDEAKVVLNITDKMGGNTQIAQSVSCIGVPTCQMGICNSQNLLSNIVKYFNDRKYDADVLPRVFISGCGNSCAVHEIGKLGFTGKKKKLEDGVKDVFQLQVGGSYNLNNTKLAVPKGEMLPETIPEFLYKLSEKIQESNLSFDKYIHEKENEFDSLIEEYCV